MTMTVIPKCVVAFGDSFRNKIGTAKTLLDSILITAKM